MQEPKSEHKMPTNQTTDLTTLSKSQRKRRARAAAQAATGSAPVRPSKLAPVQMVRQQQIHPSAFLKIPTEIFAQVVMFLFPLDVLNLGKVNRSIRKILYSRSAGHTWRATIWNVEGLPACPSGLPEPRYVFVLYSQVCSACGVRETRKIDTCLHVRLCQRCRTSLLVNWGTIEPPEVKPLVLASEGSNNSNERPRRVKMSLKSDVEAVKSRLSELKSSDNEYALQAWLKTREADLAKQREHGERLFDFLEGARITIKSESTRSWHQGVQSWLAAQAVTPQLYSPRTPQIFQKAD